MRIVMECLKTGKGKRKKEYYTAVEMKPSADHDIGVEAKLSLKLDGLFSGRDYEVGRLYEFHLMPLYGKSADLTDPNFVTTRVALRLLAEELHKLQPERTNEKGKPATVEDIEREFFALVQKMTTLPAVSGLFIDSPAEGGPESEGDQTVELIEASGDRVVSTAGEVLALLKPEGEDEASDELRRLAGQYSERETQRGDDIIFVVADHYVSYFRPGGTKPSGPSLFDAIDRAAAAETKDGATKAEATLTIKSGDKEVTVGAGALGKAAKAAGEKAEKAPAKKAPAKPAAKKKGGK